MPIVAIGAAAFAASTIAAGVATAGSFAAWAAAESFAAISAVGAITSAVGVVTGNEKLAKIGGIAALVGGVGSIGQSSGWWGDGATPTPLSEQWASTEAGAANAVDTPLSLDQQWSQPQQGLVNNTIDSSVTQATTPSADINTPTTQANLNAPAGGPTSLINAPASAPTAPTIPSGMNAETYTNFAANGSVTKPFSFMEKIDSIGGWMDKNKMLSMGAMNAIGSMFDESKKFQLEQAKRMATNQNSIPSLAGYGINSNKIPTLQPGLINRS